jgi:hypothetical protein
MKIPKGWSESVNRRRTDNIMAKRKRTKRFTKHTYKTKDRVTRTPLKTGGGTQSVSLLVLHLQSKNNVHV